MQLKNTPIFIPIIILQVNLIFKNGAKYLSFSITFRYYLFHK